MIYLCDDLKFDTHLIEKWRPLLSDMRKSKIDRYKFCKDKMLSAIAFILLRYALYYEYRITDIPEFKISERGKPYLKGDRIQFNISHCDNAVICGIDTEPIGVDIQNYTSSIMRIKSKIMFENERKVFTNERSMTRLWTLKEAYGKYKGIGLAYDTQKIDFSKITDCDAVQKYKTLKIYSREFEKYSASIICNNNDITLNFVKQFEIEGFAEYLLEYESLAKALEK